MGWSNVGAIAIQATSVTLFDNAGNVVGTLDGVGGLVFYGDGGSAGNPGTAILPDGEITWSGLVTGLPIVENASLRIGSITDGAGKDRFGIFATSGAIDPSNIDAVLAILSAPGDGSETAVITSTAPIVAANPTGGGSSAPESWHNLTLLAGWTTVAGRHAPGYRLMPDGTVLLRGSLTGGTTTAGTTIGVLPADWRPDLQLFMNTNGNGASAVVALTVLANGDINISAALGSTSFALDNCRFPVAAFS